MTAYKDIVEDALASLDRSSGNIGREIMLQFFVALARLSEGSNNIPLVTAVEYFDNQQHLMLSANELSAAIGILETSGLWQVVGSDLKPRLENWMKVPRNGNGHIASGKRDLRKWEKFAYPSC